MSTTVITRLLSPGDLHFDLNLNNIHIYYYFWVPDIIE